MQMSIFKSVLGVVERKINFRLWVELVLKMVYNLVAQCLQMTVVKLELYLYLYLARGLQPCNVWQCKIGKCCVLLSTKKRSLVYA